MKDRDYLLWIKSLPCLVAGCLQCTPTEAHHAGPRAFGRKEPDRQALPLCVEHHRSGPEAFHRIGRRFWLLHSIDPLAEILRPNREYDEPVYYRGGTAA